MKRYEREHEYSPTNREKAMLAKRKRFLCDRCDVGDPSCLNSGKCPVCGYKHDPKKKKKKMK